MPRSLVTAVFHQLTMGLSKKYATHLLQMNIGPMLNLKLSKKNQKKVSLLHLKIAAVQSYVEVFLHCCGHVDRVRYLQDLEGGGQRLASLLPTP